MVTLAYAWVVVSRTVHRSLGIALLLTCVSHAQADPIVVGGTTGANVFPFGDEVYIGGYQQVYAAEAFGRRLTIGTVGFMFDPQASSAGFNFTSTFSLGFSTTALGPSSLSSSYEKNRGRNFSTGFNGTLTGTVAHGGFSFVVPLTIPYSYDPTQGNLLLDVVVGRNDLMGSGLGFKFGVSPLVGRVFNRNGNGPAAVTNNAGLLTQFSEVAAAPAPEPATLLLLGAGLGAAAGSARTRRGSPNVSGAINRRRAGFVILQRAPKRGSEA